MPLQGRRTPSHEEGSEGGAPWNMVHCARGSRPGSPIADSLFHTCFNPSLHQLLDSLHESSCRRDLFACIQCADQLIARAGFSSLAIPILAKTNDGLTEEIKRTFHLVEEGFRRFGFRLNFFQSQNGGSSYLSGTRCL